jgi:hypothetical protein
MCFYQTYSTHAETMTVLCGQHLSRFPYPFQ